jgi:hypothetical protein
MSRRASASSQRIQLTCDASDPKPSYVGLSVVLRSTVQLAVGTVIHDGTYSTDSGAALLQVPEPRSDASRSSLLEEHIIGGLLKYREEQLLKLVGAGLTKDIVDLCPQLCSKLWHQLDIVPIVITPEMHSQDWLAEDEDEDILDYHSIAEVSAMKAHSAVRKCLR